MEADGNSISMMKGLLGPGESVNILLNFTQFFETRIEYRFQIFTAHSCDFCFRLTLALREVSALSMFSPMCRMHAKISAASPR